mgnify:CR=1 FL=1
MPGSNSDYTEALLIDFLFGTAAAAAPAEMHGELFYTPPGENGLGGTVASYVNYLRINYGIGASNWTRTADTCVNDNQMQWAANGDAGSVTVVGVGIYDAAAGGNLIMLDPTVQKIVAPSEQPTIPAGQFTYTME